MTDIRYVCLSDTHLGEESSLLTNLKTASFDPDPLQPSPVLKQLVKCLRYIIKQNKNKKKPTLILNGDILELALTTYNQAAMGFERFIELIMPKGNELFEKIIYVPGNHDHHLWESARETQYVDYMAGIKPKEELSIPWHTTNIFMDSSPKQVPLYFLTRLVRRYPHLKSLVIFASYPNYGLRTRSGKKCVIFHHGHLIESIYRLMSILKTMVFPDRKEPDNIWDLEAENFAWIDFFWSTMGRSGEAGQDIEMVYENIRDEKQMKKMLYNLSESLAKRYDLPGWGDKMEAAILKKVFNLLVDWTFKSERIISERRLSEDAEKGLWWYMNVPLRNQLINECKERKWEVPSVVSFVFGHTHKPFEEDLNFKKYPGWVDVYNTGGWVVDNVNPQAIYGGSVLLLDEELNAASVRMYAEEVESEKYIVKVMEAIHAGENHTPFSQRIEGLVNPEADPWKTFSTTAARSVNIRAQNLRAKMNERS